MFLRKLARSLSFSSSRIRGDKDRPPPQQQQQQQQQQKSRSPSTKPVQPAVEVGSSKVGGVTVSSPSSASCTNSSRAPTPTFPAARAPAQTHPPPELAAAEAELSPNPQSSATATTVASTLDVGHQQLEPHSNIASSVRRSTSTSLPVNSKVQISSAISAPPETHLESKTVLDPADHNPASNFPFRPLRLQTLSPNVDRDNDDTTTTPQPHLVISDRKLVPLVYSYSNELGTAMQRKVWVKRPGASATRVEINQDDLVDNVRDVILHKYANSLGRHIDSPDITLKIVSREQGNKNVASERVLGPEEDVGRTLDTYYPGGQTIEEALIIEVPQKRTPKPSPRPGNHHVPYYVPEDYRPGDGARDYFPPMPLHSPHIPHVTHATGPNGTLPIHSMSILTTGQVPPLPSPGGHSRTRHVRPKYPRQHTSSPTIMHTSQPNGIDGKPQLNGVAAVVQPLPPTPPVAGDKTSAAPPNRTTSPHPSKPKKKRQTGAVRDINGEPTLPTKPASAGLLDGRVPPINVLLVEDNVINLKLLEQFMKRLKVRWSSAMNGKEAVNMWRKGGFHLVLMDIQLPVMNGLEATKEIRRLESVNGIGPSETTNERKGSGESVVAEDKLENRPMFKSTVIIVALTASSLQSDRHEALAVGCNDFLTKPVNFPWMERKVTEWGCMQALIDFDGWRRWKEIEAKKASEGPEKRKQDEKDEKAKTKAALKAMFSRPPPSVNRGATESNGSGGPSSSVGNTNTTEQPSRRSHKGSRSQSGGIGTTLGTTIEEDEK